MNNFIIAIGILSMAFIFLTSLIWVWGILLQIVDAAKRKLAHRRDMRPVIYSSSMENEHD